MLERYWIFGATLTVLALSLSLAPAHSSAAGGYAVYESESAFDDVMDGLKLAIQERGLYINNIMHMGEMLERTGKDLGHDEPIYQRAESIEFCSAVLSREMTAEAPERIVNCPFIISVYSLPGTEGATYVVHREFPEDQVAASAAMAKVATMLKEVAQAAVSW